MDDAITNNKVSCSIMIGFSKVLMEGVSKATAIENDWLFTEIDANEIIINMSG